MRGQRGPMNDFIYGIFVLGPTGIINSVYPVHLSFTLLIHYHHHKYVQIFYPVNTKAKMDLRTVTSKGLVSGVSLK